MFGCMACSDITAFNRPNFFLLLRYFFDSFQLSGRQKRYPTKLHRQGHHGRELGHMHVRPIERMRRSEVNRNFAVAQ